MEDVIEVTSTASLPSLASTNVTPSRWRINLSGRPLKDALAFATALRIATKCPGLIESLCMNETSLSDTTLRHLCLGVLGSRPTVCIHRLELSGNALTDASLPPLASLLSSGCLTTALHLSQNALTGVGVESHLVPSLRQCPTLQALDLSFNPSLGDGGVGGLVECLSDTPPTHALLSLDFSSTGLGVGGAWRVARAFASLGCCPRLATLNLSFNPGLGDEGVGALAAGLAVGGPPALKTLHLDGCGFGDTGMLALAAALATAPLLTLTCTANPGVTLGPTLLLLAQLLCGGGKGAVSVNWGEEWGEEAITALIPPFVAAVALVNPSSTTLDDLSAAQYLRSSFMSEGRSGSGGFGSGRLIGKGGGGKPPLLLPSTTLLKSLHWEVGMIKQDFSVNGPKALSLPPPSQQQQQGQQVEGVQQQQGAPMSPPFAPQGRRRAYSFSPASPPSRSGRGGGGGGKGEEGRGGSSPLAPNQTQMHTLLTHPLSHSPPPRVTLELLSPIPPPPQQHEAHHHQHHLLAAESLPLSPSQFIHSQLQRHQDLPPPPTSAAAATAASAPPQHPTHTTSKPDIPALLAELLPIELLDTPLENLNPRQLAAVLSLAQSVSATSLGAKPAAPPLSSSGGVKDKGGAAPPQPPLSPLFYEKGAPRAAAAAAPPHFFPQSSSHPSTLASKMMGVMPFPSTASTASSSRSVSPTVPPPPPPMPRLPAFTPSSSSAAGAATGHDWRENLPLPPMGEVPHQQGELPRPKRSKAKGKGGGGGGGGITTNTPASTPAGVQQQAQVQALAHPVKAVTYSTLGGSGGMAVPKSMGGQEYAKVLEAFVRGQA